MKRAVIATLVVVGFLSFGFWTGRASVTFSMSSTQLLEEMNQGLKQAAQAKEILLLREMVRREMELRKSEEPVRRYSAQPCIAAD